MWMLARPAKGRDWLITEKKKQPYARSLEGHVGASIGKLEASYPRLQGVIVNHFMNNKGVLLTVTGKTQILKYDRWKSN